MYTKKRLFNKISENIKRFHMVSCDFIRFQETLKASMRFQEQLPNNPRTCPVSTQNLEPPTFPVLLSIRAGHLIHVVHGVGQKQPGFRGAHQRRHLLVAYHAARAGICDGRIAGATRGRLAHVDHVLHRGRALSWERLRRHQVRHANMRGRSRGAPISAKFIYDGLLYRYSLNYLCKMFFLCKQKSIKSTVSKMFLYIIAVKSMFTKNKHYAICTHTSANRFLASKFIYCSNIFSKFVNTLYKLFRYTI